MPIHWPSLCAPLLLAAAALVAQSPEAPVRERNWNDILGPPQGRWPAARPNLVWLEDLEEAKQIAAREDRPLFVVMRCLPCKQCADFDAAVLEGGPQLDPLLRQFVTVRLTSVQSVDLRQFPMQSMQDLDLSWWGWELAPDGSIYGVFGGKDERGDSARISVAALATTLKRVLDHHCDPRHADWNVDLKPVRGDKPVTPFDLPGFTNWGRRFADLTPIDCLHCHQVAEILRQPALDAKKFDKVRDLEIWPYPENAGIEVVRDDGLVVQSVKPDSPAAKLGLQQGDRIAAAGTKKLFSQTDLRAALQRIASEGGTLELHWLRKRQLMAGTLELPSGWKHVELGWRQSIAGGNIGANPGFAWGMPIQEKEREKLGLSKEGMAFRPYFGKEQAPWTAQVAGLTSKDLVLAINGQSPDLSGRELMAWFRLHFEPGDAITLHVRNGKGVERDVTYQATARGR